MVPTIASSEQDAAQSNSSSWLSPKKAALGLGVAGLFAFTGYFALLRAGIIGTREQQLFGYNLDIECLEEQNTQVKVIDKHPTLFLHGWGGSRRDATVLKYEYNVLPGTVVAFNFPDAHGFLSILSKTNLGQLNDVLVALYVLKQIKDTQSPKAIDLFGHSRGGAVAVNMIAVLADTSRIYDSALQNIGINAQERRELLQLILAGSVTLDCPLIDANCVFKKHVGEGFRPWLLSNLLRFGGYKPTGMQPITSLKKLAGLPLHIIYHGQTYDEVVGHEREDEFCKNLAQIFPQTSVFIRGDDGGHNHTHKTLANTIHTLRAAKSHNPKLALTYKPNHYGIGTIFKAQEVHQFCATRDLYRKPIIFPTV